MKRNYASIASEEAFLLQACEPAGAAHAGFRPAHVNRLVVGGLIKPMGTIAENYFSGSRGFRVVHTYAATNEGKKRAAEIRERVHG